LENLRWLFYRHPDSRTYDKTVNPSSTNPA
jgi:hypothetical protein